MECKTAGDGKRRAFVSIFKSRMQYLTMSVGLVVIHDREVGIVADDIGVLAQDAIGNGVKVPPHNPVDALPSTLPPDPSFP